MTMTPEERDKLYDIFIKYRSPVVRLMVQLSPRFPGYKIDVYDAIRMHEAFARKDTETLRAQMMSNNLFKRAVAEQLYDALMNHTTPWFVEMDMGEKVSEDEPKSQHWKDKQDE